MPGHVEADVAVVIGADDVTDPAAKTHQTSPILGRPILDVEKAETVLFVERGAGSGLSRRGRLGSDAGFSPAA
jgi:H+-translocating NAD(P) transhydrogenase subunit beta